MTAVSTASRLPRRRRPPRRLHLVPLLASCALAAGAIWLVAYLLWPTWRAAAPDDPARLPVSIGGVLFNVPADAVRMKVQRRAGPQERIDLAFAYPSLAASEPARHVSADTVESAPPPPNRIFLSIAVHGRVMAPEERARTIYPRYLATEAQTQDGLTGRAFRDSTP